MAPIVLEVGKNAAPQFAVIWLHGLGADGNDFVPIVDQLGLDLPIRFVFPNAPVRPVSINGGMLMPAWYDIKQVDLMQQVDWQGIEDSVAVVQHLIDEQIAQGIAAQNILLAGFSQGGVVALHAALSCSQPLAGVMALSTYFPTHQQNWVQFKQLPILQAHGSFDPIVPLSVAKQAYAELTDLGFAPQFKTYAMAHQVCNAEIEDSARFIQDCFGQG